MSLHVRHWSWRTNFQIEVNYLSTYTYFNDFFLNGIMEVKPKPLTILTINNIFKKQILTCCYLRFNERMNAFPKRWTVWNGRAQRLNDANFWVLYGYFSMTYFAYSQPQRFNFSGQDIRWEKRPCWLLTPGVPGSKLLSGSKVDLPFHRSEVDHMSTKKFLRLNG